MPRRNNGLASRGRNGGRAMRSRYNPGMLETLLRPRYLLPIEPDNVVREGAAVVVREGRIAAVDDAAELAARFPEAAPLHLDSHVLLPGLVNAHGHFAMTLLRGLGESQSLEAWLKETMWPLEARWLSPEFVADGAALAFVEMIASGTTCASDMYWFPEVVADAAAKAGLRVQIAFPVAGIENVWTQSEDECVSRGLELHDAFRGSELVRVAFGPHSAYVVDRGALQRVQMLADEIDAGIQIHLHEDAGEVAEARRRTGDTWVRLLDSIGMLTPALQAVHMTQLDDDEIERVARGGAHVVHCPSSNLKLASGVCRVGDLKAAGVNVALGSDGAASNNCLDLFSEMRTAALLWKWSAGDAGAASAATMLRMATLDGARALGLGDEIGSLLPGKAADLIAVDLKRPAMQPAHDPQAQLVHSPAGSCVSHVWVGGRCLYENGAFQTLDAERVVARAAEWTQRIAQ